MHEKELRQLNYHHKKVLENVSGSHDVEMRMKKNTISCKINKLNDAIIEKHNIINPAWASGPSEILLYFTCSGSPVQDRGFESLRNFRKGRFK